MAAEGAEADQTARPAIDFVVQENGEQGQVRPTNPLAMLCGTRAYSAVEGQDLDGQPGLFFIFWDVSVRQVGRYRMKFTLIEALPGSPALASAVSESFETVPLARFPGTTPIVTDLTRHFHRQGLKIYVPPLSLSGAATST